MVVKLRPFQLDIVRRIQRAAQCKKRIIVVQAATGAGKTTIAAHIAKLATMKGSRVLFIAHRRRLVKQISDRLIEFEVDNGIIMRDGFKNRNALVQVASRDTLLSWCVRNEHLCLPAAELVIVDEAHHTADPDSEYRRILAAYPEAVILLLTATPVGADGHGLGPWADAIECAASTTELIRDGYLMPLRVYAPDRKKRGNKYIRGIAGDLVESWKQYAEGRPTVLFCSRVAHSLDAVEAFRAAGISAEHMDADTPDDEDNSVRDRILDQVASGEIKVISNVNIIGEGVDVPELGCCQLYCEVNSHVSLLQRCGRVMRPSEGKQFGIVIDHSGAVFRHGFPDEDIVWTLDGNPDAEYKAKKDAGETPEVRYCRSCELLYRDALACPQCGKLPSKPPRSVFAPPPVSARDELLTEAERSQHDRVFSRDEKISHWKRCLSIAANTKGTFGKASMIYKQKYNEFPDDDFPCMPQRWQWKSKVRDVYPNWGRGS